MPRIIVFDEAATPQHVTQITGHSENEGPWLASGRTDFVVNPDLSLLATQDAQGHLTYIVPRKHWKHDAGTIVEFTQVEKDALTAAEAAQAAADAALEDAEDIQAGKDVKRGRRDTSVHARAASFVTREELNRCIRATRQLVDAIVQSTGGADNIRADVDTWALGYDLTNVTKAEWNAQLNTFIDGIQLDDPDADA